MSPAASNQRSTPRKWLPTRCDRRSMLLEPRRPRPMIPTPTLRSRLNRRTSDAQYTSLSPRATQPPPSDTPQVAPTLASAGSIDPIQILDWKLSYWFSLPNGCKGDDPCWRTDDDYKKHLGQSPMVLTSKQSYLIEPNWSKPYLVFWSKLRNNSPAAVELIINGTPVLVKQYPKGKSDWSSDAIDLSPYKGKEIFIRFTVSGKWGSGVPGSEWYLENIQILPSYKP